MKKAIYYFVLFSYSLVILKPVMPTLSDVMAHTFWYSSHMATVHFEHGKFHVHYDYLQAAKKEAGEKNTGLPKPGSNSNEHLLAKQLYLSSAFIRVILYSHRCLSDLPFTDSRQDYPPPESIA